MAEPAVSPRNSKTVQEEALNHIVDVLIPQIPEHMRPLLKTTFTKLGGNFKSLYKWVKLLQDDPQEEQRFMTTNKLDYDGVYFLGVSNNIWQVARLESKQTTMVPMSDWVLALDAPTVFDDERFDNIYMKIFISSLTIPSFMRCISE